MPIVSATVDEETVNRIDEFEEEQNCQSRSEAIRLALSRGLETGPTAAELVERALWIATAAIGLALGALTAASPRLGGGAVAGMVVLIVVRYVSTRVFDRSAVGVEA